MKLNSLILAAAFAGGLAGTAAGYFWGREWGRTAGVEQERVRQLAIGKTAAPPKAGATKGPAETPSDGRLVPSPVGFEKLNLDEILAAAGPMERFQAIMAFVQRVPKGEIEPALKKLRQAMQGRFDPETMFASHLLLTRLGDEDPKGAMSYLKTLDVWGQGFGTATVLATLATKDPQAAADFFKDESNPILNIPQGSGFIAGSVAKEWAKKDPAAALKWAESLKDGLRGGALSSLVGSVAVDDPAKAAKMAGDLKLDAGEDRNRIFGQVAQSWAARDPQAALAWVNGLPAGESRDEATRKALDSWATADPSAAAAHLDQLSNPTEKDKLTGSVTGPWARRDPAGAAAWLQQQPEGKGREEGVRNVMWMWTNTDPTAASTWLNSQPVGPSKDEGIITLANQTGATDPEAALSWAATISDTNKRQNQLKRGVEGWLKKDPAAAQAWVQSSPSLTPDERVGLLGGK